MALSHSPSIVTDGLILCLDAANFKSYPRSGVTWSNVINYNQATNNNGLSYQNINQGIFNYDGTDDNTTIPLSSVVSGAQATISIWSNSLGGGGRFTFWFSKADGTRTMAAAIPWSDNVVYWDAGDSGTSYNRINKLTTISERTGWHNWVFTKNATAGTMRIYLDGVQWHSGSSLTNSISASTTAFLGSGNLSAYFYGSVGSFFMYNKELNFSEVLQNFNALRGRFNI